ncbi:MAG TPA: hypothetical protein DCM87_15870 [Planctomycetes bacterium]|nr:hypothetical protein [Planctomycetota bacterium]
MALGLLWSCGGGGGEETTSRQDAKASAIDRARASAEKAKGDAEAENAAKYAPKAWNEAERLFAEGEEQVEADDAKAAKLRFDKARSKYTESITESKRGKKSVDDYAAVMKDVAALQRKAKDGGADKAAAQAYAAAVEKVKSAEETLKESPAAALRTLKSAKQDLADVIEEAKDAAEQTRKQEKEKLAAEEEKKIALAEKQKADDLDAAKTNPVEFGAAADMLRNGDRALEDGRFDEALYEYRGAKDEFRMLVQMINEMRAADAATGAMAEGPRAGPDTDTTLEEPKDAPPESAASKGDAPPAPSGAAGVWAFLDVHKGKLFNGLAEFSGGKVLLNYASGADLRKDSKVRKVGKSKLDFTRDEQGTPVEMSFEAGGDTSCVFFNPQFVREVRVSMTVEMGVVLAGDAYVVLQIMSDKSGNAYGSKFGAILGRVSGVFGFAPGAPTTVPDAMTKPPKDWVKKERRDWVLELAWPEGQESGTLTAMFGGEEVSKVEKIKPRSAGAYPSGRVAVSWNKCMFAVKNLKIEGILDQKWALGELQKEGVDIPEEILVEAGLKKPSSAPTQPAPKTPSGEVEY